MRRSCAPRSRSHSCIPLLTITPLLLTGCIAATSTTDVDEIAALGDERVGIVTTDAVTADPARSASSWPVDGRLDPDTAVRVAIERDPAIRRAIEQVAIARARLAAEDRAPNPMIEFGIGVPVDGISGAPAVAMFAQQITWLWTRGPRLDAATARHRATILDAAAAIVDLDQRVRRRHADAIAAEQVAEIASDAADAAATMWRLVDTRAREGEATTTAAETTLIAANEAALDVPAARTAARAARIALLAAIGVPAGDPDAIVLVDGTPSESPIPGDEHVIEQAATARFDVAAATCRLDAAAADAELAGLRRVPEVSATLMWNRNFVGREALLPGARITLPIFDDGRPAEAMAAAAWRDAALALLKSRRDAIAEARLALDAWRRASGLAAGFEASVLGPARAAESLEAAAEATGSAEPDRVLEARLRRLRAERRLVDHRLAAETARLDLTRAVGGVLPTDPVEIETDSTTVISRRDDA